MNVLEVTHALAPAESWRDGCDQAHYAQLEQKARALEWEVQRRIMLERALADRDRELSDFLENALEGLLKVGPDGTVFWANAAGLELLGCDAAQCIGRSIARPGRCRGLAAAAARGGFAVQPCNRAAPQ